MKKDLDSCLELATLRRNMDNRNQESKRSSSDTDRRRSRSRGPPPRLEWPALFSPLSSTKNSSFTNNSVTLSGAEITKRKDPKTEKTNLVQRKKTRLNDTKQGPALMWVDKYAPTKSSDLCMAPKKVKEAKEWMEESSQGGRSKLLILTGKTGIGKSTMVRVLASELGFSVLEWDDTQLANSSAFAYRQRARENNDDDPMMFLQYQSRLGLFEDFLRGGSGFQTLAIVNKSMDSAKERESVRKPKGTMLLIEEVGVYFSRCIIS